jgi:isoquinoline 1-oxidoreductase alpha subunit
VIRLVVNGAPREVDVPEDVPLLWVLRGELGLTGTKFGFGMALCGACAVHLDGEAVRPCVAPVGEAAGLAVTTIEGLGRPELHPLQQAWIEENVVQDTFCADHSGRRTTSAYSARVPAISLTSGFPRSPRKTMLP